MRGRGSVGWCVWVGEIARLFVFPERLTGRKGAGSATTVALITPREVHIRAPFFGTRPVCVCARTRARTRQ